MNTTHLRPPGTPVDPAGGTSAAVEPAGESAKVILGTKQWYKSNGFIKCSKCDKFSQIILRGIVSGKCAHTVLCNK